MSKITFNTLKIEGFGCIVGYKSFKLDDLGLNLIRGENGEGKTTRFSALTWVLYDRILKKGGTVETWEHLRPETWSGTMGSVTFIKGGIKYKIIRCKDYTKKINGVKGGNRLIIEEEGEPVAHLKDKRDLQKYLEAILGMSFSLFTSAVLFPQKAVRFVEESGPNKKAILEESFKINWITKAQDKAKDLKRTWSSREESLKTEIDSIGESIRSLNEVLEEIDQDRENFLVEKEEALKKIRDELSVLTQETKAANPDQYIPDLESKVKTLRDEFDTLKLTTDYESISRLEKALSKAETEFKRLKSDSLSANNRVNTILESEVSVCPQCGQSLKGKTKTETVTHIQDEILKLSEKIQEKSQEIQEISEKLESDKKKFEKFKRVEAELTNAQVRLSLVYKAQNQFEGRVGQIKELTKKLKEKEKEEYRDNSPKIKASKYQFESRLNQITPEWEKLKRRVKLLTWAINDPLSNSGIKSFLFDKLLAKLNMRLRHYEKFTGIGIKLEIDLTTGRKNIEAIIMKEGAPVDYRDLSGGESKLADMMVALGCGDVLLSDNSVNLRVYDEATESLDPTNTEIIINLLRAVGESHSVYMISHNPGFYISGATIIDVKKDG